MYGKNIKNAKSARIKSRNDEMRQKESIDIQTNLPKYFVVSVDMQKILQFPILSTKDNNFNDKINLFNETISQLGENGHSICYIAHDCEVDKKSSEICNIYWKFFESNLCQNANDVIIKCDNCYAQNKSWLFLSNLIRFVNHPNFKANSITIDYYESGHTYVSADSVHGNITQKLNKTTKIFDFYHMMEIIKSFRSNMTVEDVKYNEIYIFNDETKVKKNYFI
jgi:hypothetical protein